MYRVILVLSITTIILTCGIVSACSPRGIIVPSDSAQEVTEALGYALAPTWLPRGFEFAQARYVIEPINLGQAWLFYWRQGEMASHQVALYYPTEFPPRDEYQEGFPLATPDNAVSEIVVNNKTAYLVRGAWPSEIRSEFGETGKVPANAEWDYNQMIQLEFGFDLPDGRTIGVQLSVFPNPGEWTTVKELVRIAESVKPIE